MIWKYCPHCYIWMCCCWQRNYSGVFCKVFINYHLPMKVSHVFVLSQEYHVSPLVGGQEEEQGIIFLFLLYIFNAGLCRIPRTHRIWHSKKNIIANLHKVSSVFRLNKVSIMQKQHWAPPESLTKAQIQASYSLLLYYSNRIKYQSCIFFNISEWALLAFQAWCTVGWVLEF